MWFYFDNRLLNNLYTKCYIHFTFCYCVLFSIFHALRYKKEYTLTYNFQAILLLYLLVAVVVDHLVNRDKSKDIPERVQKLVSFRSILFVSAALPLNVITSVLFWAIFLYDPYLIAPHCVMILLTINVHINWHLINLIPICFELLYGHHKLPGYTQGIMYFTAVYSLVATGYVHFVLC